MIKAPPLQYVSCTSSKCHHRLWIFPPPISDPSQSPFVNHCCHIGPNLAEWSVFTHLSIRLRHTGQRRRRRCRRRAVYQFQLCNFRYLTPEGSNGCQWCISGSDFTSEWLTVTFSLRWTNRIKCALYAGAAHFCHSRFLGVAAAVSPLVLVLSCSWSPCGRWERARQRLPHRFQPTLLTSAS